MNTGIGHQVGLEFSEINVQGPVESQRGRDRRHNLADQSVQIGIRGSFDVQITTANVVNGFVVDHESAVGVFQGRVSGQNGIVRLNHSSGHLKQSHYNSGIDSSNSDV